MLSLNNVSLNHQSVNIRNRYGPTQQNRATVKGAVNPEYDAVVFDRDQDIRYDSATPAHPCIICR